MLCLEPTTDLVLLGNWWRFACRGKGANGKKLTSIFAPLPEPANYFRSSIEMLYDTTQELHYDPDHIVIDGIRRDRFPPLFLQQSLPGTFSLQDYSTMDEKSRESFLGELANSVEADDRCQRSINNRIKDAIELSLKRTRWNYKTAIPQYHPRRDEMSLLLPLSLVSDEVVDIALVVTRNESGSYQGRTVIPLDWAYQNARLVCRPDSDWLVPDRIRTVRADGEDSVDRSDADDEDAGSEN
jgi:uncharacterized protein DUF3825